MMKNTFHLMLRAPFVLEIFKFLSGLSDYVETGLDRKAKVNFKICDNIDCITNNFNTYIVQYLKK